MKGKAGEKVNIYLTDISRDSLGTPQTARRAINKMFTTVTFQLKHTRLKAITIPC